MVEHNQMAALAISKINAVFVLRINNKPIKEVMEERVDNMAATWLV